MAFPNYAYGVGSTSRDDDDMNLLINGAATLFFDPNREQYDGPLIKVPCRKSLLKGRDWVEELIYGHPMRIMENCRITVDNFLRLCAILVEGHYVPSNPHKHIHIEESLAMTLVILSHSTRTRVVAERFQHSIETIHRNVKEVVFGLCMFAPTVIRPKNIYQVHSRIRDNNHFDPYFEDAIGAIDGTHISASVVAAEQIAYTNKHGTQSQNVLGVCDFDMCFTYVYAGWEGSAHDARVLEGALRLNDFPLPPPGKYYLVDAAYKMVLGFMPPFKGARQTRGNRGGRGRGRGKHQNRLEMFNTRHSQLRNVIGRTFGVLKKRFAYLRGPVLFSYMETQINVVIACCALHYFLREFQPNDDHFAEYEEDIYYENGEVELLHFSKFKR